MALNQSARVLQLAGATVVAVVTVVAAALILPRQAHASGSPSPDLRSRLRQVQAELTGAKGDAAKLKHALQDANDVVDRAEQALEQAEGARLASELRTKAAVAALAEATARVKGLRAVLDTRARSLYISGSPAGLDTLIRTDRPDALMSELAVLDHLAQQGNSSLADLVVAEKGAVAAEAELADAQRQFTAAARASQALLTQAENIRAKISDLRARVEARVAVAPAAPAAPAAAAPVVRAHTVCDLSGTSDAEFYIIMHESHGDPAARNPSSTAFGLGQLLLSQRIHYLGADLADTLDCGLQLRAFRGYVRDRYGTAEAAQAFWVAHHWY
jgi:peptidoglycan hydrolase CwlO-like protein